MKSLIRDNQQFLKVISTSFNQFINVGTSRSPIKLKPLHGAIAEDLAKLLGSDFTVCAQGYDDNKEGTIQGRYMDKKVDIAVYKESNPVAGIEVKFIMQNYSQNSNNYFENMLGETANIRSAGCPFFHITIILDCLPYYDKQGKIKKWETFTSNNAKKYTALSADNPYTFYHTPNKTLICVVHIPDCTSLSDKQHYIEHYKSCNPALTFSTNKYNKFGSSVILNDYSSFMVKVYHTVMAQ